MKLSIREHVPLRDMTTFRIGGPARYFCLVTSEAELVEAIEFARGKKMPVFILGGGSNILVGDDGFDGLVIKMEIKGVEWESPPSQQDLSSWKQVRSRQQSLSRQQLLSRQALHERKKWHKEKIGQLTTNHNHLKDYFEKEQGSTVQLSEKTKVDRIATTHGAREEMREIGSDDILVSDDVLVSDDILVTVGAGENWDDFVAACVSRGLCGLENLSGIPGTVGAAPVQNIGAYGAEVSQTIESVRAYDTHENVWKIFLNDECAFEYRESVFKNKSEKLGRYVISSVTFALKEFAATPLNIAPDIALNIAYRDLQEYISTNHITHPTPADIRTAVLAIRAKKLPDVRVIGTAGSFFKNPIISQTHFTKLKEKYPDLPSYPAEGFTGNIAGGSSKEGFVKVPLGWILDHICGYKGAKKGAVGTYKNQALVIVNDFSTQGFAHDSDATATTATTAAEIKSFAAQIAMEVKEKTGIDIELEVQYIG